MDHDDEANDWVTIARYGTVSRSRCNPREAWGQEHAPVTIVVVTTQYGPCARCQTRIKRYGPGGRPLCEDCRS